MCETLNPRFLYKMIQHKLTSTKLANMPSQACFDLVGAFVEPLNLFGKLKNQQLGDVLLKIPWLSKYCKSGKCGHLFGWGWRRLLEKSWQINSIRLRFVSNWGHWLNFQASPATKQSRAVQPKYSKVPGVSCREVKDVIWPIYIIWYVQSPSQEILVIGFLEGRKAARCHSR